MTKTNEEKDCKQILDKYIEDGKEIHDKSKKQKLILKEGEKFTQVYADTPVRRLIPKHYFFSDENNLVSLATGKPVYVRQQPRENGRPFYILPLKDENGETLQCKNVEVHNLAAIVHGADVIGKANDLLKKNGIFAFGINNKKELKVQGHHKDGNKKNNEVNNIQLLTSQFHTLIENAPNPNDDKEVIKFMIDLSKQAEQEEINQPFIVFDGYVKNKHTGKYDRKGDKYVQMIEDNNETELKYYLVDSVYELQLHQEGDLGAK